MQKIFNKNNLTLGSFCLWAILSVSIIGRADQAPLLPEDSIYHSKTLWINQNGKTLSLKDFRGKNVVISLVYMTCQYSCPLTIARMKEVEEKLKPAFKKDTHFVLATFDIKRDTPNVLLKFAEKNKLSLEQWTLLTTEKESSVRELSTLIDFKYKAMPSGDFEHSFAMIALDKEGRLRGRTEGAEMSPQVIADLLNK